MDTPSTTPAETQQDFEVLITYRGSVSYIIRAPSEEIASSIAKERYGNDNNEGVVHLGIDQEEICGVFTKPIPPKLEPTHA